jgi:hypothetical protein
MSPETRERHDPYAARFGPVIAVVAGGIGTIVVVLIMARVWPEMVRLKTLNPEAPVQEAI